MSKEIRIISLLILDTAFFLLEAIVGYSVHSLALVADSFHMLNDIISLVIALWAVKVKNTRKADGKYTYGWQRAEILGALINAVFLLALCFSIVIEAILRFFEPPVIRTPVLILVVGSAGLASNIVGLFLFHEHGHSHSHSSHEDSERFLQLDKSSTNVADYFPDSVVERVSESTPLVGSHSHSHDSHVDNAHKHSHGETKTSKKTKSMNMEGVFLHVLGDALGNVGVIITALFIWKTDFSWKYYTDPFVSLVITMIIFSSALPLCRKSSKILLQATPPNVNSNVIVENILKIDLIKNVHDFHIWNLNEDILIASLHVELVENCPAGESNQIDRESFLHVVAKVREILHKFGIHSATIQPEFTNLNSELSDTYGQSSKDNCIVNNIANCDTTCH
jgi:zinc transporter 1